MPLLNELDSLQKKALAAIKVAEERKKEVLEINKDVTTCEKGLDVLFKDLIRRLSGYSDAVSHFESDYDRCIEAYRNMLKDLPKIRMNISDANRYFLQLSEEKEKRDKAKKKAGQGKPTKEDQIFEAAYDKALKSHEQATKTLYVQEFADDIDEFLAGQKFQYKDLTNELKKAMTEFDSSVARLYDVSVFKQKSKLTEPPTDFEKFAKAVEQYKRDMARFG
jgi:uncharacterized protein Yka (UPF0111/DUF47 family)